ncbi:MAG TPA: hypothetical protein VH640_12235 [Bryobacteraceae bacterium]
MSADASETVGGAGAFACQCAAGLFPFHPSTPGGPAAPVNIDRFVTIGRYGPSGEASYWTEAPDLSKVDEVGFVDLIPWGATTGRAAGGTLPRLSLYGPPVK